MSLHEILTTADSEIVRDDIVVCSFYTDDDYYRAHAETLRGNVEQLGLHLELEEIHKRPDDDWADLTRRKIAFLNGVCLANPDKRVYWIDVDCSLLAFPEFVAATTADLIGFQRGFGTPSSIGYLLKTRFWEPCFFGINTTPAARKFMADAAKYEREMDIKATDDYFFEESWRANGANMTFQIIPSPAMLSKAQPDSGITPFFSFGASGNVAEFKLKVEQHSAIGGTAGAVGGALIGAMSGRTAAKHVALQAAKRVERALPTEAAHRLRRIADRTGMTHRLTAHTAGPGSTGPSTQAKLVNWMISSGQKGDAAAVENFYGKIEDRIVPGKPEIAAKEVANSFAHYASPERPGTPVTLAWWVKPFPGNFGDWLSPLVLAHETPHPVRYVPTTAKTSDPHLFGIGSVGRFIKPSSIVVGTGISTTEHLLEGSASYHSVRGPITAQSLRDSGGPDVESFGDPGVLLRRAVPLERGETTGRVTLVRHFTHANVPLVLPDHVDELDVRMSHPSRIQGFLEQLVGSDYVLTSAMHVMIACHSYGIPCGLINFEGLQNAVPGTGIKYADYSRGAGLDRDYDPQLIRFDLTKISLEDLVSQVRLSDDKLDEVEQAMRGVVEEYLRRAE